MFECYLAATISFKLRLIASHGCLMLVFAVLSRKRFLAFTAGEDGSTMRDRHVAGQRRWMLELLKTHFASRTVVINVLVFFIAAHSVLCAKKKEEEKRGPA